jgi:hypothetical protein
MAAFLIGGDMKYPFLIVTCGGPRLFTQERFEEFLRNRKKHGLTEQIDDVDDYEALEAHQYGAFALIYATVDEKAVGWELSLPMAVTNKMYFS